MALHSVELGKLYKDNIHGIEGVAVAHCKYMTGCNQIQLEYMKEGDLITIWFDITRLVNIKLLKEDKKPGGPQAHAPSRHR